MHTWELNWDNSCCLLWRHISMWTTDLLVERLLLWDEVCIVLKVQFLWDMLCWLVNSYQHFRGVTLFCNIHNLLPICMTWHPHQHHYDNLKSLQRPIANHLPVYSILYTRKLSWYLAYFTIHCAVTWVVSSLFITSEVFVHLLCNLCGICGRRSGTGASVSWSTYIFPCTLLFE